MFPYKNNFRFLVSFITVIVLITTTNAFQDENENKIEDTLEERARAGETSNVMIQCGHQKSLNPLAQLEKMTKHLSFSKARKQSEGRILTAIVENIFTSVVQSQDPVLKILDKNNVHYNTLWMSNRIFAIQIIPTLLAKLASLDIVTRISLDRIIKDGKPRIRTPRTPPTGSSTWNLGILDARCSSINCLGTNVKIGFVGYGINPDHVELHDNWAGPPFGWWDAGNPDPDQTTPQDFLPPGSAYDTSSAGLALGKNIGVAPNSKWMACNNLIASLQAYSPAAREVCGHYMACPWRSDDPTVFDCSQRPDIVVTRNVHNPISQLFDPTLSSFQDVITAWNLLGIISVSGVGENGPDCNSAYLPGLYGNTLTIGSVDENKTLSDFSSRGPVITNTSLSFDTLSEGTCPDFLGGFEGQCIGRGGRDEDVCTFIKPDGVAPGESLNVSLGSGSTDYGIVSGTNLAAGQVAGVIALMICGNPGLNWNSRRAYDILRETDEREELDVKGVVGPDQTTQVFVSGSNVLCNLIISGICDTFPNNLFGHGLVNACRAVDKAKAS